MFTVIATFSRKFLFCGPVLAVLLFGGCAGPAVSIDHYLTYSAKGTRSEARHGHLKIDGYDVPWAFQTVSVGGQSYSMRFRSHLWGDDGYFPDITPALPPQSEISISENEITCRYYLGREKKAGTPKNWIFVRWKEERSAFVAPVAIGALIEAYEIPIQEIGFLPIVRPKNMRGKPGTVK